MGGEELPERWHMGGGTMSMRVTEYYVPIRDYTRITIKPKLGKCSHAVTTRAILDLDKPQEITEFCVECGAIDWPWKNYDY
jgi:hypothetical protein